MVFISLLKQIFLGLGNLSASALVAFAVVDYDLTLPIAYHFVGGNGQRPEEFVFLGDLLMWQVLLVIALTCWALWFILNMYEHLTEKRPS